jgi:hypothetical protein
MSETTTTEQAGGTSQPVPADDHRPSESLSSEPDAPEPQESTPTEPAAEPHQESDSERWDRERKEYNRRLGQITRQKYQEKERAARLERELAEIQARMQQGQVPDANGLPADWMRHPEVQRAIQAQAAERAQVEAFQRAGAAEFPDWDKRRNDLIEMGADAGIAQLLVEMPGGHRVAAALHDEPAELERIADLKTERARALALGQFAARLEARRAQSPSPRRAAPPSSLPPPIQVPSTTRHATPDPEKGSMDDYLRYSRTVNWRNR